MAMDVARYRAMLVATAGDWKWTDTLMKRVNGGDGSSGFEVSFFDPKSGGREWELKLTTRHHQLERRKKTPKPKVAPTIEAASMSPPSTPPSPSPRSLDPCLCGGCNLSGSSAGHFLRFLERLTRYTVHLISRTTRDAEGARSRRTARKPVRAPLLSTPEPLR